MSFHPNTATHGQSNVIRAAVEVTMPATHPEMVKIVRAKPLVQTAHAKVRSAPRNVGVPSVSSAPAKV
ncbi:MAG: hypothetical protein DMF20_04440 [Verrucomicrobia bacterium]|nr:MAG: hypothetical protein DMF20_04440 [Verrucomicrobiota bacterium]